jgi:hypothetical protein
MMGGVGTFADAGDAAAGPRSAPRLPAPTGPVPGRYHFLAPDRYRPARPFLFLGEQSNYTPEAKVP